MGKRMIKPRCYTKDAMNEKKINNFQYMLKKAGSSLCFSISNYIRDMEDSSTPYTVQDIRSYMERGFNILKKKHPGLPDDELDKCIYYVIDQMDRRSPLFHLKDDIDKIIKKNKGDMKKKAVRLNESQLKRIIKESVKKALVNEISSDLIARARDKFIQKYGNNYRGEKTPGEMDSQLKRNRYNMKLHPKTNRPLAWHQADYDRAYEKAKMDENPELIEKATELVRKVKDWSVEETTDQIDYHCEEAIVYGEAQDENGEWWSFRAGGIVDDGEVVDVAYDEDIEFETPDGFTGHC